MINVHGTMHIQINETFNNVSGTMIIWCWNLKES